MREIKLPQLLKVYRKYTGFSQNELAKRIGISQQLIGAYESGRYEPSFSRGMEIAFYIATHSDEIIDNGQRDVYKLADEIGMLAEVRKMIKEN